MSKMTKEINRITGTVIGISGKLILYAAVILLLVEGMSRGYAFGHEIFYATAMEAEPGTDKAVTVQEGQSVSDTAAELARAGLIDNRLAFQIQKIFYDYEINPGSYTLNTSMTSKEILQALNAKDGEESETEDGEDADGAAETAAGEDADGAAETVAGGDPDGAAEAEIRIDTEDGGVVVQ